MGETDLPAIARIYNLCSFNPQLDVRQPITRPAKMFEGLGGQEARRTKATELDDIERDLVVLELKLGE
jgi:hypothetical protein